MDWITILVAGVLAGAINVMVGAGTLVSFPLLLLLGVPPLQATIANTIGILPGSLAGVAVYRRELRAHRHVVRTLLPASAAGGVLGSQLLLRLPAEVFAAVVPWLIAAGSILVVVAPLIRRRISRGPRTPGERRFASRPALIASVTGAFLLGVYGGYFSAAQGVLLIGLLGATTVLTLQELNAVKNLTVAIVNGIAALVFVVVSPDLISWNVVAILAGGAVCGGVVGGSLARRLPPVVFRICVVLVGAATVVTMVLGP